MLTPIIFLQYQVDKYSELLANSKTIEERIFRRKELYRLKLQLQSLLN